MFRILFLPAMTGGTRCITEEEKIKMLLLILPHSFKLDRQGTCLEYLHKTDCYNFDIDGFLSPASSPALGPSTCTCICAFKNSVSSVLVLTVLVLE